jgi:Glycine zipper
MSRRTEVLGFEAGGERERRTIMRGVMGADVFLSLAALLLAQPSAAQDPLAGAIIGGAVGGLIGGAVGKGGGAVAGAVIGAAAGATIAAEAQQRQGGYYWWRGGCYYRYPNGSWLQVAPGYCG